VKQHDRAALRLALDLARRESPARAAQIAAKLKDDGMGITPE
jgi:hypothetical protein